MLSQLPTAEEYELEIRPFASNLVAAADTAAEKRSTLFLYQWQTFRPSEQKIPWSSASFLISFIYFSHRYQPKLNI